MLKQSPRVALLCVILALLLSILLSSCNGSRPTERVPLTIGFRPTVVVDLALLRAIERGDFKEAGIDVTLKPYGRADLLFAALRSGEIQGSAGVPLEPVLDMATRGEYLFRGYIVWYFDSTTPYDGFIVPSGSPVTSLNDLSNKVVGSHPSKQVKYFVTRMLPNSTIQEYNPATPLLSLKSGDQSAAYVLEPTISQAVTSGEYRLIESSSISRRIFDGARVPAALSILSAKWIEEHPTQAAAFVRIARAAQEKELQSRDTAANAELLRRKEFGGYSAEVASRVVEPSSSFPEQVDKEKLRLFFQELEKGGLLSGGVDFDRLLYIPPPK